MLMILNEEQRMLQDAANDFCSEQAPISVLRRLRDENDAKGFDRQVWQAMIDMGWAGITIPEELGGTGFGIKGLGVVMQACGRTLTASPLLASSGMGAAAIMLAGSDEQKQLLLPRVASGDTLLAFACEETTYHAPLEVETEASVSDASTGCSVSGSKTFVLDGHVADKLIVTARSFGQPGESEGLSLVLIDANDPGVTIQRTNMLDSRNAANVTFREAQGEFLGEVGHAAASINRILDIGRSLLAAEMLGGIEECFERTIEYLKVREQFGVPIGSFQALKHRAADMFCEIELCKSVVLEALTALDADAPNAAALISLAKAQVNDTYHTVTTEGVQMHGGIGMTDEHEIGFFLKRSRVCEHTFGNSAFHTDRFGKLHGY